MNLRRMRDLSAAAMTGILVAAAITTGAVASQKTTNKYDSASVSGDIAESCRHLSFSSAADDGVLSGTCNKQDSSDDPVEYASTSIDLDNVFWCDANEADDDAVFSYGTDANTGNPWFIVGWTLSVSSNGSDYIVSVRCRSTGIATEWQSLDLGDTTDGLKNDAGAFAEALIRIRRFPRGSVRMPGGGCHRNHTPA